MNAWTIYDHPKDRPNCFVARRFENANPTLEVLTAPTLDELRRKLPGVTQRIPRDPRDDLCIVEVWI